MNPATSIDVPRNVHKGPFPGAPYIPGLHESELPGTAIKVLIADDHPIVRSGIKQCINDNAGMCVAGEAGTAQEMFDCLKFLNYDVLVLDIGLPDQSGLEVLRILKKTNPDLPVLILTMYPEDQFAQFCLRAGAAGFLSKANASVHLVDAIRQVAGGNRCAPQPAGAKLMPDHDDGTRRLPHEELSAQKFQIFCQIAAGKTRKMIAKEKGLSLSKVNALRIAVLKKMRMTANTEIVAYARTHQLLS